MVFRVACLFRAPTWCTSGGGSTREVGGMESLVALYRVGTHQIRRGRRAARSSTSQGSAEPLCPRIKGTNRELSGKIWSLATVCFLPTRAGKGSGERAKFVGLIQGCTELWTTGCWLVRWLHQLKVSTTMDLGISIFLIFVCYVALKTWAC